MHFKSRVNVALCKPALPVRPIHAPVSKPCRAAPVITIKRLLSLDIIKAEQCVEGGVNPKVSERLWRRRRQWAGQSRLWTLRKSSVSGSLVTEVLRHRVALAQVRTQEGNEGERIHNISRGIQSASAVNAGSTVAQPGRITSESARHKAHCQ